jgi:hypothetical protein
MLRDGSHPLGQQNRREPCLIQSMIPHHWNLGVLGSILALALLCGGCAPTVEGASKSAAKGATTGGVQSLEDPETRQRVAEIAGSPEVQKAIEEVAGDATKGAAQALTDAEMTERTRRMASIIAADTTKVVMRTMAEELSRTVGPAIENVGRDTSSAVRTAMADPDLRAAMGSIAFDVSRQAVFGSNEATAELERNKQEKGTLARVSRIFKEGGVVLAVLLALLLVGVLVLSIALVQTRAQLKRFILDRGVAREAAREAVDRDHHGPMPSPT